jgi:hypothetical protein
MPLAAPTDVVALNFFFDPLLFCGAILLLANSIDKEQLWRAFSAGSKRVLTQDVLPNHRFPSLGARRYVCLYRSPLGEAEASVSCAAAGEGVVVAPTVGRLVGVATIVAA